MKLYKEVDRYEDHEEATLEDIKKWCADRGHGVVPVKVDWPKEEGQDHGSRT